MQSYTVIVNNSNNIKIKRTTTSHFNHKMATLEIKGPGFAQTQKCDGVKPVKRNPNPSDNWVSYSSQVGY